MPRHWKEPLEPTRHVDHSTNRAGGRVIEPPPDPLIPANTYFVAVPGFTFEFQSLSQLEDCLDFFSRKTHPSSIQPDIAVEHYWQRWYERLPLWLFEEPKRQRTLKALRHALDDFQSGRS